MIAFLLSLWANPLVRKILLYAGIAVAAGWAFKVFWLNPHDDRVAAEAVKKTTDSIEKTKKAEWAAKEKSLAVEAATLAAARRTIDAQASEIAASRAASQATLAQIIAVAKQRQEQSNAQVIAVPASALDDTLRSVSASLAATH